MTGHLEPSPFKFGYYYDADQDEADQKAPQFYGGERHILLFGLNGAGKSTRILLENLVTIKNRSLVIVDIKGELAAQTMRTRARLGDVKLINPYNVHNMGSHGFNPLAVLDPDDDEFFDKAKELTLAMIESQGDDNQFFTQGARNWFCAGIMWEVLQAKREKRTASLLRAREWCLQPDLYDAPGTEPGARPVLVKGIQINARKMVMEGGRQIANLAGRFARDQLNRSDQDVLGTLASETDFLISNPIARDLEKEGWSFAQLKQGATAVYIVLPPNQVSDKRRWTRMLMTAALQAHLIPGPIKTLFIFDEFRVSVGHLPIINDFWALVRGYGVQFMPVCQSVTQLQHLFKQEWENYTGQAGIVVTIGPPGDSPTAEWMSRRSGNKTIWQEGFSEGEATGGHGPSSNFGGSLGQVERAFILPQELMSMKVGTGRIWPSGHGDISIPFFAPNYWQRRELEGLIDDNPYFGGGGATPKAATASTATSPSSSGRPWAGLFKLRLPLRTKLFIAAIWLLPIKLLAWISIRNPTLLLKIKAADAAVSAAQSNPEALDKFIDIVMAIFSLVFWGCVIGGGVYAYDRGQGLARFVRPWLTEYAPLLLAYLPTNSGLLPDELKHLGYTTGPAGQGSQPSAAFTAGKTDWMNWFAYVHGQSGDNRVGIDFWSEFRNDKNRPSSCLAGRGQTSAAFRDGCEAARKFLSGVDQRRLSEPDYRQGWNAGYNATGDP